METQINSTFFLYHLNHYVDTFDIHFTHSKCKMHLQDEVGWSSNLDLSENRVSSSGSCITVVSYRVK